MGAAVARSLSLLGAAGDPRRLPLPEAPAAPSTDLNPVLLTKRLQSESELREKVVGSPLLGGLGGEVPKRDNCNYN